ncbi:peptide-methionine (S)-S-oxide reductase [candidate division WWE3 bacterium RIFOXYD1_FULL_43_17]|uniref:Peptide methionine sulfoxide reductase MsrA n=3 Tax=Katanobacteria TaxID=422282 RepID=A0A1F4XBW1_UNCKA|nr:MAG: Peptide methionine sulfoxide reductase [candidate division WWE3 bacterium GW2011_GWE1_41_27]KKS60726.1 MAG: Peptide methionine sulfoxide reductase [candidate division WWE3 bacterium GW2011_GWF2_42_42]OGC79180.1 MAG: peptide-methionine (S)-S-oxide reductase [candidate division WWE3 bacterium RIFOXYD1_FULL_43_17]
MKNELSTATLAGGCFWCTEALFKRLEGVSEVLPGYAGGHVDSPTYEEVCRGDTGHAEAIQIKFDPAKISYGKILEVFWNTHDPTTINRQGHDTGPQYRSVIFYHGEEQKKVAVESKEEIEKSKDYRNPVVTEILPFTNFFVAEDYHKNYYDKNMGRAYCDISITPKVHKLMEKYGDKLKEEYQSV